MSDNSKISWTDATWSCVRGCSRVSAGCQRCYAEVQAARIVRMSKDKPTKYDRLVKLTAGGEPRWTGRVELDAGDLALPLRWARPRRIFVNSMSDLFHESLTNEQIAAVFGVMAAAPRHTFQILTKRAKRMREWFAWVTREQTEGGLPIGRAAAALLEESDLRKFTIGPGTRWPLRNVWIGVSVENQVAADERIPDLLASPAAVRFLSCEPLIGPIDLSRWLGGDDVEDQAGGGVRVCGAEDPDRNRRYGADLESCGSPRSDFGNSSAGGSGGRERLPKHPSDGRWQADDRAVSSRRLAGDQRSDTAGPDDQPQERVQVGQRAEQPRAGNGQRSDAACDARAEARQGGASERRAQPVREADRCTGPGDSRGQSDRTHVLGDRGEVRSHIPAGVANRARTESLDWIICGCESGPGARPCDVQWLRSLRDQCTAAAVPFFLKQARETDDMHGSEVYLGGTGITYRPGSKRKAGGVIELPHLDGVRHAGIPEVSRE